MRGREERRRRELYEHAQITAAAFHEPSKISELLRPSVQELAGAAQRDPGAWDDDEWWKAQD